ncbi:MAG: radical SAM protein [Desulfomonile tiedjei]|nr:radical SAM protein [Desulfomonile tiedjei]
MSTIRNLSAFANPFLKYHLTGKPSPVLGGYKITYNCNLKCRHCPYWNRSVPEQDFPRVRNTLERLRGIGVQILILEGGEPLLWRDGKKNIRHVIEAARRLFRCVCITTNGTLSWADLELDRVWVSLDGPRRVHDEIRGQGVFDKVWKNLEQEGNGRALVSTTISTANSSTIQELLQTLRGRVAGVTIQFYYPYAGLPDPLFLPFSERAPVLEKLKQMKKDGYPVANSLMSLEDLKKERWTCEEKFLANAEPDGTVLHGCYLRNRGASKCSLCGFSAHNEMSLAFKGKMEAIRTGMGIFFP